MLPYIQRSEHRSGARHDRWYAWAEWGNFGAAGLSNHHVVAKAKALWNVLTLRLGQPFCDRFCDWGPSGVWHARFCPHELLWCD